MTKIVKSVISGIIIGITIGYLLALTFSLLYGTHDFYPSSPSFTAHFANPLNATLISTGLWALMGVCFSITSLVFQNSWGITRQTLTHLVITYFTFTPLAILAGWFPVTPGFMFAYSGEFLLIYIIIWSVGMHIAKKKVRELNQRLAQRKAA
ncbi:MAG: DUF3021 domain-containing protein [Lactobacillus sp.]|jgi:uncharacterized membrane protein|nr:DUF3021 domain-containing protein [Lactobacillus sp.]MCI2034159.1 DUF3021 domain-containing protein [Lactobacillus sp.]